MIEYLFSNINYLLAFTAAFTLSAILTPITIKIYKRFNLLDDPVKSAHPKVIHARPVPRGGGIPIFLAILLVVLLFIPLDKYLLGILLGGFILLLTGIFDDIYDIHPAIRLATGSLAALCVIAVGIGIPFITNPFSDSLIYLNQPQISFYLFGEIRSIWVLADIFAFIWILSLINFMNWSKGLDGQLPGITTIAAITIAILATSFSSDITQWETSMVAIILAGAFLGFLPFNYFPQKIMPGYGGGALAGFFLAVLSVLSTTKVGTLLVVLGVPIIDAVLVIIRRIWHKKSPIWGDTRHLHHQLLKIGVSRKKVTWFYWIITAILGTIALQLNSQQKLYTIILLILLLLAFLLWVRQFASSSPRRDLDNG